MRDENAQDPATVHDTELETDTDTAQDPASSEPEDSSDEDSRLPSRSVQDEISRFEESFKDITRQFRIVDRIGEGTFSTVYKAEDLQYSQHRNDWDLQSSSPGPWVSPPLKPGHRGHRRRPKYVALKKIYVTSSPLRILNELELLHDLRNCNAICPLITAFRHHDQVVAVLPYYRHQDFREYFREMTTVDMKHYMRSLFDGLAAVHRAGIIHRDIKPTNFLYHHRKQHGVLVDFGLAEREGTDSSYCICIEHDATRRAKVAESYVRKNGSLGGYPRHDTRPSRRANRAGTRGFRAPEVLFKCTSQSTKIDVWSAGVILLTMMGRRFPFFNSTDDIDATIEIASIFGRKRMVQCALLHGAVFDCTIPSIGERGFSFDRLVQWSDCRAGASREMSMEDKEAIRFMERCLDLDPRKRISAEEALQHDFLLEQQSGLEDEEPNEGMDVVGC